MAGGEHQCAAYADLPDAALYALAREQGYKKKAERARVLQWLRARAPCASRSSAKTTACASTGGSSSTTGCAVQARLGSCLSAEEGARALRALGALGIPAVTHADSGSRGCNAPMVIVSSSDLESAKRRRSKFLHGVRHLAHALLGDGAAGAFASRGARGASGSSHCEQRCAHKFSKKDEGKTIRIDCEDDGMVSVVLLKHRRHEVFRVRFLSDQNEMTVDLSQVHYEIPPTGPGRHVKMTATVADGGASVSGGDATGAWSDVPCLRIVGLDVLEACADKTMSLPYLNGADATTDAETALAKGELSLAEGTDSGGAATAPRRQIGGGVCSLVLTTTLVGVNVNCYYLMHEANSKSGLKKREVDDLLLMLLAMGASVSLSSPPPLPELGVTRPDKTGTGGNGMGMRRVVDAADTQNKQGQAQVVVMGDARTQACGQLLLSLARSCNTGSDPGPAETMVAAWGGVQVVKSSWVSSCWRDRVRHDTWPHRPQILAGFMLCWSGQGPERKRHLQAVASLLGAGSCDELDKIKTSVLIVDCQCHVSGRDQAARGVVDSADASARAEVQSCEGRCANCSSSKAQYARRHGIPLLSEEWLWDSIAAGEVQDLYDDHYALAPLQTQGLSLLHEQRIKESSIQADKTDKILAKPCPSTPSPAKRLPIELSRTKGSPRVTVSPRANLCVSMAQSKMATPSLRDTSSLPGTSATEASDQLICCVLEQPDRQQQHAADQADDGQTQRARMQHQQNQNPGQNVPQPGETKAVSHEGPCSPQKREVQVGSSLLSKAGECTQEEKVERESMIGREVRKEFSEPSTVKSIGVFGGTIDGWAGITDTFKILYDEGNEEVLSYDETRKLLNAGKSSRCAADAARGPASDTDGANKPDLQQVYDRKRKPKCSALKGSRERLRASQGLDLVPPLHGNSQAEASRADATPPSDTPMPESHEWQYRVGGMAQAGMVGHKSVCWGHILAINPSGQAWSPLALGEEDDGPDPLHVSDSDQPVDGGEAESLDSVSSVGAPSPTEYDRVGCKREREAQRLRPWRGTPRRLKTEVVDAAAGAGGEVAHQHSSFSLSAAARREGDRRGPWSPGWRGQGSRLANAVAMTLMNRSALQPSHSLSCHAQPLPRPKPAARTSDGKQTADEALVDLETLEDAGAGTLQGGKDQSGGAQLCRPRQQHGHSDGGHLHPVPVWSDKPSASSKAKEGLDDPAGLAERPKCHSPLRAPPVEHTTCQSPLLTPGACNLSCT